MWLIPLFLFALLAAEPSLAASRRLPPKDECARDTSFRAFREKLQTAVARKDARQLLALTSKDIRFNFGGGGGRRDFGREWRVDKPARSKLWEELGAVLRLGCAMDRGSAQSPYLFARFPERFDPFQHVVVVTPRAVGRAAPNKAAKAVATFDSDILPLVGTLSRQWVQVRLGSGHKAFVRRADVRSPVDYRAIFEKRRGRWAMTAFIAGD